MRRLVSLSFVIVSILITSLFGEILELQHMRDMEKFVKGKKTLVVFDLDNTVIEPKGDNTPGSDQWFTARVQREFKKSKNIVDAIDVVLPAYYKAHETLEVKPVESDTCQIIEKLQNKKIPVMALTARRGPMEPITFRQLKSIDLDFKSTALTKKKQEITDCCFSAEFKNGILFGGNNDKGKLLLSYLEKVKNFKPSRIVMIDDKGKYLDMAESALKGTGIDFIGLRYGFLDEKVKSFVLQDDKPSILNKALSIAWTFLSRVSRFFGLSNEHGYDKNKIIISFFGPPGAGKGTLAEQCAAKNGFKVLCTGNLFREHIANKTLFGKQIEKDINSGRLVSDSLTSGIVREWLLKNAKLGKPIILDGSPRTSVQVARLLEILKKDFSDYRFKVIYLNVSENEAIVRIMNRRVCANKKCQAVYNRKVHKNDTCLACGGKLITRKDDKEEVIRERFRVYREMSLFMEKSYKDNSIKVDVFNTEKATINKVYERFMNIALV